MQASTVLVSVAPCRRHRTVLSRVLSAAPPPKHLPLHSRSPLALFRPRANTARTPKFAAVDNYLLSRYNYLLSHGQQLALALQCGGQATEPAARTGGSCTPKRRTRPTSGGVGFEVGVA